MTEPRRYNESQARYLPDPRRLAFAETKVRFFRAPSTDGTSRHFAVVAIPHAGDPARTPYPLTFVVNAASNWSVVRVRRSWHAVEPRTERGLEAALGWLSRPAALPTDEYERARLPWYLDPSKESGMITLMRIAKALVALPLFDPRHLTIEMAPAQGKPFAFERPKATGLRTDQIRPGSHRIRIVRPDTGRQIDLFGSEGHLRERIARIGGDRRPALQFYCCPVILRTLGLEAPFAAVSRLGAREAARRGLAPVVWDRHGDDSLTNMPRA